MAIYHIRDLFRRQIEEQSYAQMMRQTVVSKTKVVPGEVERFYNSIDKDSLPIIAEQYQYAQITMFPKNMKVVQNIDLERTSGVNFTNIDFPKSREISLPREDVVNFIKKMFHIKSDKMRF
jgi:hypothetical protein